jgi:hypothetical protein
MAGLGNPMQPGVVPQQAGPAAQAPAMEPAQQVQGDGMQEGSDGEPATPEEQAAYEKMMEALGDVLYPKAEVNPTVLQQLSGQMGKDEAAIFAKADPPFNPEASGDALAGTAVLLIVTVDSRLGYQKQANAQEDDANPNYAAVLMESAKDLASILAEISQNAGIHDYTEDELNNAWLRGTDLYQQVSPTLDREMLKEKFIDLAVADKQGRLGEVVPQLPLGEAENAPPEPPMTQGGGGLGQAMPMQAAR